MTYLVYVTFLLEALGLEHITTIPYNKACLIAFFVLKRHSARKKGDERRFGEKKLLRNGAALFAPSYIAALFAWPVKITAQTMDQN